MKLFKAIRHIDKENFISSKFSDNYLNESSWEDLINSAFTHISHGDRKKASDCWISTTKSYEIALEYLNNTNYNFNGIAVLDLSATKDLGYIYDSNLRNYGYIDKEVISPAKINNKWEKNSDGVVVALDMSSEFTIAHLASYLWLKGNQRTLGNCRAQNYAINDKEVLLLGEDIKFEFIEKENAHNLLYKYSSYNNTPDYYLSLYKLFVDYAPNLKLKDEFYSKLPNDKLFVSNLLEYEEFYSNEIYHLKEHMDLNFLSDNLLEWHIDEKEIEFKYDRYKTEYYINKLNDYYPNASYHFDNKAASYRFKEFNKLDYKDRDLIDFNKYNPAIGIGQADFDSFLYAYAYSLVYIFIKNNSQKNKIKDLFNFLNLLYNNRFIFEDVSYENFFNYYTKSLGIFKLKESFDYTDLDDFF